MSKADEVMKKYNLNPEKPNPITVQGKKMIKDIYLPDLGEGIEDAEISEVAVDFGDIVTTEDTILVLESDKASMEIPAEVNGTVIELSLIHI